MDTNNRLPFRFLFFIFFVSWNSRGKKINIRDRIYIFFALFFFNEVIRQLKIIKSTQHLQQYQDFLFKCNNLNLNININNYLQVDVKKQKQII